MAMHLSEHGYLLDVAATAGFVDVTVTPLEVVRGWETSPGSDLPYALVGYRPAHQTEAPGLQTSRPVTAGDHPRLAGLPARSDFPYVLTGDRTVESQQGDCPMPQQPGLSQLNLVVRDMDATLGFYRRLGLDVEADPGAFHAATRLPSGLLIEWDHAEFFSQWNAGWNATTGGSAVLGFWVTTREAVDDLYSDLTGAGHNGHQPPYDAFWGGRYAIVEDPDGNSIGLMSPTDPTMKYWPPSPPPQATSS